jgi:hypothetical protein
MILPMPPMSRLWKPLPHLLRSTRRPPVSLRPPQLTVSLALDRTLGARRRHSQQMKRRAQAALAMEKRKVPRRTTLLQARPARLLLLIVYLHSRPLRPLVSQLVPRLVSSLQSLRLSSLHGVIMPPNMAGARAQDRYIQRLHISTTQRRVEMAATQKP